MAAQEEKVASPAQTALDKAQALFEKSEFAAAAQAADDGLLNTRLSVLAGCAVLRGKAILAPLLEALEDESKPDPSETDFREAWVMFQLALRFHPENEEAQEEVEKLQAVISELPEEDIKYEANHPEPYDVIIVGAGASGVGTALLLCSLFGLDPERVLLVDRGEVGETFRRWPKEMRFISPSFNSQGWTQSFDLNSVAYGTSPAFTVHQEHPSGAQYATYLQAIAETNELSVKTGTDVTAVNARDGGFDVEVKPAKGGIKTTLKSRYVVWAAGEFQYPRGADEPAFPGAELCTHNSSVRSWATHAGDDFIVIGGYESGMDAASNLSKCGKKCTVVASTAFWDVSTEDPSSELAPYTSQRIRDACAGPTPPKLLAPLRVFAVEKDADGYVVKARWGENVYHEGGEHRQPVLTADQAAAQATTPSAEGKEVEFKTPQPPLLCAGFAGSCKLGAVKDLFAFGEPVAPEGSDDDMDDEDEKEEACDHDHAAEKKGGGCLDGAPLLTPEDESTVTPGLFLVGPSVVHGTSNGPLSFCFVYKFRQRFGVVADAIARGLGRETDAAVGACRDMNMFLDDFECCKAACGEAC